MQIMNGRGEVGKDPIFPQKATHTQILAMTGKLKSSDARIQPPAVAPRRKWLGEDKGWG